MSFNIIIRNYDHYNSSMGKRITSKRHYEQEMVKGGYIPFDKACEIAEKAKCNNKPYELSKKAREIIQSAHLCADNKGKIDVGNRMIKAMKEVGVSFYNSNVPKHYKTEGGFNNAPN